jgi:Family of unknown function (DUF6868)
MKTIDEVIEVTAQVLIRCTAIGIIVLLIWWGALELFGDLAYNVHSRTAPMSRAQFDIIHYVGMLLTKSAVSLFFFIPYIAIRLVIRKRKQQSSNI